MYSLIWPEDQPHLTCIVGQYERLSDGRILATYESQAQLAETLATMLASERAELEDRLERGLEMIEECDGGKKLARLLERWRELIDQHQRVLGWGRAVMEVLGERTVSEVASF
jgi:hypothetical protein